MDPGWSTLLDGAGGFFDALTFFVFGAVVLGPVLDEIDWRSVLYAVVSLTLIRMLPVALSLVGSNARRPTVAFIGWFGPWGLASIVFVVIVADSPAILNTRLVAVTCAVAIALSVYAHGATSGTAHSAVSPVYAEHPDRARSRRTPT